MGLLAMLAGTLVLLLEFASVSSGADFPWPKALEAGLLLSTGLQTLLSSFLFSFLGMSFRIKKLSGNGMIITRGELIALNQDN